MKETQWKTINLTYLAKIWIYVPFPSVLPILNWIMFYVFVILILLEDDNDDEKIQVDPNFGPTVKSTTLSQMEAAIVALSRELSKLRTGRASAGMPFINYLFMSFSVRTLVSSHASGLLFAGMLDHILVETGGVKMPLNHVAVVSVINSKTLSVTPYDPTVKSNSWTII